MCPSAVGIARPDHQGLTKHLASVQLPLSFKPSIDAKSFTAVGGTDLDQNPDVCGSETTYSTRMPYPPVRGRQRFVMDAGSWHFPTPCRSWPTPSYSSGGHWRPRRLAKEAISSLGAS